MTTSLSTQEIQKLLAELPEERQPAADHAGIRSYQLVGDERIVRGRLPALELTCERLARELRDAFSRQLGRAVSVEHRPLERLKFGLFTKRLTVPSSLHLFRLAPLKGEAVLVFSTPLVHSLVESSFGGRPRAKQPAPHRELSAIENRLTTKFAGAALESIGAAFEPIIRLEPIYRRAELNPLALNIAAATDEMVTAHFEVQLEEAGGVLTLAIPWLLLEPIKQKLSSGFQAQRPETDHFAAVRMESALEKATVSVSVELGRGRLTARELLALRPGSVLQLQNSPRDPALVKIEGVPKFTADIGDQNGSRAAKIRGALPRSRGG